MSGLTPEQIDLFAMAVCNWWESGELAAFPESPTHLTTEDSIPCSACRAEAEGLAPVVAALIAEAVEESRGEVAREITAIHRPWTVCDDCDHEHTDKEVREGLAFDTGYSYTCTDAALYIACAECCVNDDEQTEECADYHRHTLDPDTRCATAALAARIARGEVSP